MLLNKATLAVIMAVTLNGCSQFQAQVNSQLDGIERVEAKKVAPGAIGIAYEKFELDNGLTVIIHEDNSDPLVHVDVTYHVGSAREELGKSGFAHLFEHMMFQGSKHVADEQHVKMVTEAGGRFNATTNTDRTNYYQTVPSNQLEKMLWLEADRMGFFAQGITQEKFAIQRAAVKNERMMRYDNVPYGQALEKVHQTLYDYGHPYSWLPIGYMSDLNRASASDLKAFFKRWYGPNNATLTIGGAVNSEDVLPLVKKYFGSIPKGESVKRAAKQPTSLTESRFVSYQDNVSLPMLRKVYPTVYLGHQDEAALDAIGYLVGQGQSSLLYRKLVNTQQAVAAFASHWCLELACKMTFGALPHPAKGKTLSQLNEEITQLVDNYIQDELSQKDIDLYIAKKESEIVRALQSVKGKVSMLAEFETFHNDPSYLQQQLNRIKRLTVSDIKRVYNQHLEGKPQVVLSIVPKGQKELITQPDNFTPTFFQPSSEKVTEQEVTLPQISDEFDRSEVPKAAAAKPIQLPALWQAQTDNGIDILGTEDFETPTTTLLLQIPAGRLYDQENKNGVALLTTQMLEEATMKHSSSELAQKLAENGAEISFELKAEYIEVTVSTLSKNLLPTLNILSEKLLQPKFSKADFVKVKSNIAEVSRLERSNASFLADGMLSKIMYQDGNYRSAWLPSLEELNRIELEDIKGHYKALVRPQGSKLSIVSNISQGDIVAAINNTLEQWNGRVNLTLEQPKPAELNSEVVYLVHKEDAPQVEVRVAGHAAKEDLSGVHFKSKIMNFAFSGGFNSRLNQNLREDKGYTYGIGGRFKGYGDAGQFIISSGVEATHVAAALQELQKELERISKSGLSRDELEFTRNSIAQRDALKYETPAAKLRFFAMMHKHNVDANITKRRAEIIKSVSKKELNLLAKKYLSAEQMTYVVVGDATSLTPQLESSGFTVKQVSL
ncbi:MULTISPECIES: M16 family metallopeptidase [unclassified Pseudoalteromonas]|uniref:M16 family metallopeptidase n=1 Tax=unclassified Pseudoalteromonas TaxID=194690 RepID=UPI003014E639